MSSFSAARKPKFTRTCSMLSQYLKQNGSFGELSRGMTCNNPLEDQKDKTPITMNLLPTDDFSPAKEVKPMELFPRGTGFVRSLSMKEPATTVRSVPAEVAVEATQDETPLTIFYAGKVVVFDKLRKDKAKEILDYADVISTKSCTPPAGNDHPSGGVDLNLAPILASDVPAPAAVSAGICSPGKANLVSGEEKICKQNHVPIARKASLHRFLEKRKDRIIANAPYQVVNNTSSSSTQVSTKPEPKKKSWLNLASSMPPPPPPPRLQLQL